MLSGPLGALVHTVVCAAYKLASGSLPSVKPCADCFGIRYSIDILGIQRLFIYGE